MSAAEEALAAALTDLGLLYEREFRFDPVRRWRADFNVRGILVEVQGRGRHQTVTGYRGDCEKLNAAQLAGWRVLWFPADCYKPSASRKLWPRGARDWADEIYRAVYGDDNAL